MPAMRMHRLAPSIRILLGRLLIVFFQTGVVSGFMPMRGYCAVAIFSVAMAFCAHMHNRRYEQGEHQKNV